MSGFRFQISEDIWLTISGSVELRALLEAIMLELRSGNSKVQLSTFTVLRGGSPGCSSAALLAARLAAPNIPS